MWSKEFAKDYFAGCTLAFAVINGGAAVINEDDAVINENRRADTRGELDHIAKGSNMVFTNPPRACPVGARDALSARC